MPPSPDHACEGTQGKGACTFPTACLEEADLVKKLSTLETSVTTLQDHLAQLALELLRIADYEQGLKYAREAIRLAPKNFVAHVACGRLWLALGKTDQSLPELQTAVKFAPGSPDAHFALSQALSEAGRNTEAAHERAEFERLKALADAADRLPTAVDH